MEEIKEVNKILKPDLSLYMNENFTDIVDEVKENGYAKIENFISKPD